MMETGWYVDQLGRRWHCVVREHNVVCHSTDGSYTCAFHQTFKAWGWKPEPAGRAALEQEGK